MYTKLLWLFPNSVHWKGLEPMTQTQLQRVHLTQILGLNTFFQKKRGGGLLEEWLHQALEPKMYKYNMNLQCDADQKVKQCSEIKRAW